MIKINKIEFINYRQYKNITVDFISKEGNNLFILKAKNGTGKTTFLNGILWCLYNNEYYISDKDKALPIINSSLVKKAQEQEKLTASVKVTVDDSENIVIFERFQYFIVKVNHLKGNKTVIPGQTGLKVIITPKDNVSNTKVYEDELEVNNLVKQYFDESIYSYYFFDGENLKNYFEKSNTKKIKDSIFNISQVTLLANAISHLDIMQKEKSRLVSKMFDSDGKIYTNIENLEKKIKRLEEENEELESLLPDYRKKYTEADEILKGYAPIRSNTAQRDKLERELTNLKIDYSSFKDYKKNFIRESLVLLNLYPRIKNTLDMILEKQKNNVLPPSIDKNQVSLLLSTHAKTCPMCDSVLDEKAIKHLTELLEKLDVTSSTSNYLMEIKSSLEIAVNKCLKFPEELEKINKDEKFYRTEIEDKEQQVSAINGYLARYASEGHDEIDVSKVEKERNTNLQLIKTSETKIELNKKDIKLAKIQLDEFIKEREKLEQKTKDKSLMTKQVAVYRTLESALEEVQNSIMEKIKDEIQNLTWNSFAAMIWKKNTFGSITIDDQYSMSVFDVDGNETTGTLSATERMALAYAFTLAIHEASGKNCPLVVDSPLGRSSDENRTNMATELLKLSKNKQIIMLFTPDEYSAEVKAIYESANVSIRDIVLSGDEKEIEKVGA